MKYLRSALATVLALGWCVLAFYSMLFWQRDGGHGGPITVGDALVVTVAVAALGAALWSFYLAFEEEQDPGLVWRLISISAALVPLWFLVVIAGGQGWLGRWLDTTLIG